MLEPTRDLAYLITVSRAHFMPCQMLLLTLRERTQRPIVVVGNLEAEEAEMIRALGARYVDERDVDLSGRLPGGDWTEKAGRGVGWYRQMLLRLSIDRFVDEAEHVVILDAEVFVFNNWDERRLFAGERPHLFYWVPATRKPEWDYRMYRGAAHLLSLLPECANAPDLANRDDFHRHISGVVMFSRSNVAELWRRLEAAGGLSERLEELFLRRDDLAFSDHDTYGIAAEAGVFDNVVPVAPVAQLLGWYDNHDDPVFHEFRRDAMWSMDQLYNERTSPSAYRAYMERVAAELGAALPKQPYWNDADRDLVEDDPTDGGEQASATTDPVRRFARYRKQLDLTERKRYATMAAALEHLAHLGRPPVIAEIGTLRDATRGGGHSTYKFAEFCAATAGHLHTVDISADAVHHAMRAASNFQPWITFHTMDSEAFLRGFDGRVDLLYLDGYDSTPGETEAASKKQLAEARLALSRVADDGVILLDDVAIPGGGKAIYSSDFLADHGFALTIDAYQQLFVATPGRRSVAAVAPPRREKASSTSVRSQVKKAVKRVAPGVIEARRDFIVGMAEIQAISSELQDVKRMVTSLVPPFERSTIWRIEELLPEVEPYQPIYGLPQLIPSPQRVTRDRCEMMDDALGNRTRGMRMLDIGASLGYVPFYFAERGARADGWDLNPLNTQISQLVQSLNGLPAHFATRKLTVETARAIAPHEYDVAFGLSVFHHIIHHQGLDDARAIVAALVERIPILFLELALPDEDPDLFWSASQPADVRALLDDLDVDITELALLPTHLSATKRPLLKVVRRNVVVNGRSYVVDGRSNEPYAASPVGHYGHRRRYQTSGDLFIKEYLFESARDERAEWQLVNELAMLMRLRDADTKGLLPRVVDYSLEAGRACIIFERRAGALLDADPKAARAYGIDRIAVELLEALALLETQGLHHNDVRSWNVILGERAYLIDFGLAAPLASENNAAALLRALAATIRGEREPYVGADELPPTDVFNDFPVCTALRAAVNGGVTSPSALLDAANSAHHAPTAAEHRAPRASAAADSTHA